MLSQLFGLRRGLSSLQCTNSSSQAASKKASLTQHSSGLLVVSGRRRGVLAVASTLTFFCRYVKHSYRSRPLYVYLLAGQCVCDDLTWCVHFSVPTHRISSMLGAVCGGSGAGGGRGGSNGGGGGGGDDDGKNSDE